MSISLPLRMALYFFLPIAAAYGFGEWDEAAGTFTIVVDVEALIEFLSVYAAGFLANFGWGRVAKAMGKPT